MRPLRPWQRLQWRLTLACVGATLGLALLLEVAVLGALGLYLLRSEDMAVEVAREALGRATLLAPALAAQPPDVAALERGQRLLEEALRMRRWGEAQAEELRGLLPEMTSAQQLMLAQRLSASINRGELVVETTDFPF